jgi:hypothetical protein
VEYSRCKYNRQRALALSFQKGEQDWPYVAELARQLQPFFALANSNQGTTTNRSLFIKRSVQNHGQNKSNKLLASRQCSRICVSPFVTLYCLIFYTCKTDIFVGAHILVCKPGKKCMIFSSFIPECWRRAHEEIFMFYVFLKALEIMETSKANDVCRPVNGSAHTASRCYT